MAWADRSRPSIDILLKCLAGKSLDEDEDHEPNESLNLAMNQFSNEV